MPGLYPRKQGLLSESAFWLGFQVLYAGLQVVVFNIIFSGFTSSFNRGKGIKRCFAAFSCLQRLFVTVIYGLQYNVRTAACRSGSYLQPIINKVVVLTVQTSANMRRDAVLTPIRPSSICNKKRPRPCGSGRRVLRDSPSRSSFPLVCQGIPAGRCSG